MALLSRWIECSDSRSQDLSPITDNLWDVFWKGDRAKNPFDVDESIYFLLSKININISQYLQNRIGCVIEPRWRLNKYCLFYEKLNCNFAFGCQFSFVVTLTGLPLVNNTLRKLFYIILSTFHNSWFDIALFDLWIQFFIQLCFYIFLPF